MGAYLDETMGDLRDLLRDMGADIARIIAHRWQRTGRPLLERWRRLPPRSARQLFVDPTDRDAEPT